MLPARLMSVNKTSTAAPKFDIAQGGFRVGFGVNRETQFA